VSSVTRWLDTISVRSSNIYPRYLIIDVETTGEFQKPG
jgi:hypothetical protein